MPGPRARTHSFTDASGLNCFVGLKSMSSGEGVQLAELLDPASFNTKRHAPHGPRQNAMIAFVPRQRHLLGTVMPHAVAVQCLNPSVT